MAVGRLILLIFVGLVVAFLLLPTLVVVPMSLSAGESLQFPPHGFSLQWYQRFLDPNEPWLPATLTSLSVGVCSAITATILGGLAAFGAVRGRFPGKRIVLGFVFAPLVMPLVVLAIGIYFVFIKVQIAGSFPGLVAAHTVLSVPIVIVNVAASLRGVNRDIELAAASLGASPFRVGWHVTLPLVRVGLLVGAIFAFLTSWDEIVMAIFLTSPFFRTLPVVVWSQLKYSLDPTVYAVSSVILFVSLAMFASVLLVRRPTGHGSKSR